MTPARGTLAALLVSLAVPALAQEVYIGGNGRAEGRVDTATAVAIGSGASAANAIGAIAGDVRAGGSLSAGGRARTATAVAIGSGEAYVTVGSATGSVRAGGLSVGGAVGNATAVSIGGLACTSTLVGSVSSAPHCAGPLGLF